MPRYPDIGWQYGKMIGGHRHHVQCNYCHKTMVGGITRFKKHLANKRGEIKGCESVPKEVREIIKKHLITLKAKKAAEMKQERTAAILVLSSTNNDMESDASDPDEANARHELPIFQEIQVHSPKPSEQQYMVGTTEFSDTHTSVSDKEEQRLAPSRATDPGWAHAVMVNGDRQKIKCRYCRKIILGGGISRLKQHLAGERGNIAPCKKVPDDVKAQMQQHLGFKVLERFKRRKESKVVRIHVQHNKEKEYDADRRRGKEVDEGSSNKGKRMKRLFVRQTSPTTHSTSHGTFSSQESINQADIAVAKFMYHAGVPPTTANSHYFQRMADAIAKVGPRYKMPSYYSLRGKLFDKCAIEVGEICQELRKSWEVTGCTVMVDRWTDKTGRTIIDFFAYCPKGTMFLKSVDAFCIENSPHGLVDLFESIVQEVGPKNIVNFLTDSSPCCKAAGMLLTIKYKIFFWSMCSNHCIELMLNGLSEIEEVKQVLEKAKKICQFIYNKAWVLDLMREKTKGREIFQPAMSEFVTKFLTLENIVCLKDSLHQVFTSSTWKQSAFSKQRPGVGVMKTVLDPQFWLSCTKIMEIAQPLLTVLRLANSKERPAMGYLYDAMEKAKKDIISAFDENESKYLPYLEIIERALDEFHSPLHAAAYYLNPSIYYNPSFSITSIIQKGLLDCIETLEPNTTAQDNITRDKAFYEDAVGDFRRPVALRGRESSTPATWWSLYASDYPDLQRFAVRILSQTCSIMTSERNWTVSGCTRSSKNRLEHQRLNDLAFVHYNLRIQQQESVARGTKSHIEGEYDPIWLEGKSINRGDWTDDPGVLEGEDIGWMNAALPDDSILARKDDENLGIDDGGPDGSKKSSDSADS